MYQLCDLHQSALPKKQIFKLLLEFNYIKKKEKYSKFIWRQK